MDLGNNHGASGDKIMSIITTMKNSVPVIRKTDNVDIAIERAVKSAYGKNAEWFENTESSSETRKFGQIGKSSSTGGYNMITNVIYIDVD